MPDEPNHGGFMPIQTEAPTDGGFMPAPVPVTVDPLDDFQPAGA